MPNPSNEFSQAAKKAGLSYWGYMSKKHPEHVMGFVWGVKRVTRKQERENDAVIMSAMASSNHPAMRLMGQMRNLIGRRGAY